jgi:hypothetical protein
MEELLGGGDIVGESIETADVVVALEDFFDRNSRSKTNISDCH